MARNVTPAEFVEKSAKDALWFIESALKVAPKEGGRLVNLRLNAEQLEVYNRVWEVVKAKKPVRFIILKGRRFGISTLIEALAYWMVSNKPHTDALIISHDLESARKILAMSHRFANNDARIGLGVMPGQSKSNKYEIAFDNPNWRERGESPGLGSTLTIATAENKQAARSQTLQFFHGSEVAFWLNASLVMGVFEALSNLPGTMGFLESTANGASGYFYETYWAAKKGRNEWTPIFLTWKNRPECRVHLSPKQKEAWGNQLTEIEWQLGKEYGLDLEQLAWRRMKIASYEGTGRDPVDAFRSEYPLCEEEAFVSTGRQYFDLRAVQGMKNEAAVIVPQEGWLEVVHPVEKNRPKAVKFHPRRPLDGHNSLLTVWKHPEPGADYVVGADVAMGLSGGDASVAYVMRRDTLEYVARLSGQIEPDAFADLLWELAWYYNEAFLCPENNSIGMSVAKKTASKYTRHAYQVRLDKPWDPSYDPSKPGWNTNNSNRREMFAYLRQLVRDRHVRIWCDRFFDECADFIVPEEISTGRMREDKPRAKEHKHDDHIAAAAITLQANDPILAGCIRRKTPVAKDPEAWREVAMLAELKRETEQKVPVDDTVGVF